MTSWGVGGKTVAGAGHQLLSSPARNQSRGRASNTQECSQLRGMLQSRGFAGSLSWKGKGRSLGKDSKAPGAGLSEVQNCASRVWHLPALHCNLSEHKGYHSLAQDLHLWDRIPGRLTHGLSESKDRKSSKAGRCILFSNLPHQSRLPMNTEGRRAFGKWHLE